MTEPTKEQVEKWRNDFEKGWRILIDQDLFEKLNYQILEDGTVTYRSQNRRDEWQGYLTAKKSDFEEIKTLKEEIEEFKLTIKDLTNSNFRVCDKCLGVSK